LTETGKVLRVVDILTETNDRMRFALSKRTLLETALIRCGRAATVVTLEEVLARIEALRDGGAGDGGAGEGGVVAGGGDGAGRDSALAGTVAHKANPDRAGGRGASEPAGVVRPPARPATRSPEDEVEMLRGDWAGIVGRIGHVAVGVQAPLRDARPISVSADKVMIGFDPEFESEIENFKLPRNRMAVEHVLGEALKRQIKVEFSVMTETARADLLSAPEPEATPAASDVDGGLAGRAPEKKVGRDAREWMKEAPVRKVVDLFGGKIVGTRE
jgi:hypothetical protein